jgi:hypothetical protein
VPVVASGRQQRGQGELVDHAGAAVTHLLLRGDGERELGRRVDPAEADRGNRR